MIAIIDYGMGNLRSVQKALELLGAEALITSDPAVIDQADKVILPGVGAFKDAMDELASRNLIDSIKSAAKEKPFLGICLGLQLLFSESEEGGIHKGLDIIPGRVIRFDVQKDVNGNVRKVPHMGWNALQFQKEVSFFKGLSNDAYTYFVHSYYVSPELEEVVAAKTDYGVLFPSVIVRDNLWATQFHPEKSQRVGLTLLQNFIDL